MLKLIFPGLLLFFFSVTQSLAWESSITLKPPALKAGDKIAIIAPGFQIDRGSLDDALKRLKLLGLNPVFDKNIFNQYGYFAGTDQERSAVINKAIRDDEVKAIISLKGGYGTANLLDKIDYEYLKKHPKIIIGRSDLTALLLAVYTQCNLVTFYGPSASVKQTPTSLKFMKMILFQNHQNKVLDNQAFSSIENQAQTITPGIATGQLLGGNLSVLVSLIGTPYFPKDWHGKILFLEDVNENVYAIDRMLGQLKNMGLLNQISGFVFGTCQKCKSEGQGSFTLDEVIERYIKPLKIPAYSGALIGHQDDLFTVPIGSMVELNAGKKQLKLIEPATKRSRNVGGT